RTAPTPPTPIGCPSLRLPSPLVPHHHRPAAVLPFWNNALKAAIVDRMIFYLHCKPFVPGEITRPFGNGPTLQHPIPAESKIVVQMRRRVLLDHKGKKLFLGKIRLRRSARFTG